ncbi:MAG: hypothetical protein V4617_13570 [Gemmatimonadota bacterium]
MSRLQGKQDGQGVDVNKIIDEAVADAQAAANAAGRATTVNISQDGTRQVIDIGGRKLIVNTDANGRADVHWDGEPALVSSAEPPPFNPNEVPDGVVDIVQSLGATLVLCVVGFPIARAFGRWVDRRGNAPKVPTEVLTRLNSIEQAVESVAIEVERISEGQRFTTKLLNDRATRELADAVPAREHVRG